MGKISVDQKQIVADYEEVIADSQQSLIRIRHDMAKVRTMTFKKIYDLHKQVQIAEALELGYRRLSVASATEIERERRHHSIKIQRQLSTLKTFIQKSTNSRKHGNQFEQMIEIQHIMSNSKIKCFFCVFLQTMAQTIIDIELTFNNLNSELPPIDSKVNAICNTLYGIEYVLENIESAELYGLNDKVTKCVKFLNKIKSAIQCEESKEGKVKTFELNKVILIIARKVCKNWKDEIIKIESDKVAKYAESKTRQIFEMILNGSKIFETMPKTKFDAAAQILKRVYNINATQMIL